MSNFLKHLFYALPLALMFLLALTPGISFTEDLGRHLLLGKIIVTTGHIPDTNFLTYTCPNFPFINHHWLSEVFFYLVHRAVGLNGLILLKALLMCATLALAMRSVPLPAPPERFAEASRRVSPLIAFAATLAAIALGYRAHIRPELFTYLGVALYGWLIARFEYSPARKLSALSWAIIIAYGWFWANAHICFIFGIGMIGAYWFACWWCNLRSGTALPAPPERFARASLRAWPRAETLGLISLIGVSLLNPNGWRGLLYPLGIFGNYGIAITENASPLSCWETVLNPMLLALPFLSLCALWVFWRAFRLRHNLTAGQLAGALILLAALIAAWCMARSAPLLALTLLPPLFFCARAGMTKSTRRSIWLRGVGITVVVALNLWLAFAVVGGSYSRVFPSPIGPTPFGFDDESRYMALRRLRADGLPGKIFSDYNSGSLVEYNIYPERGYVDNRPEAFPAAFWQKEYEPALALGEVWEDMITRRDIQTVAVSIAGVKERFIHTLLADPRWQLVHQDFFCAVFTRNTPENQDFLRRHAFGPEQIKQFAHQTAQHMRTLSSQSLWRRQVLADQIVYEIYGLICLGESNLAWPLVWDMHLRYPDYQLIHELMRVSAPPRALPAVMDVMERRARWPLAAKQVLDWGAVLEAQGKIDEARAVYRRGQRFFPRSPNLPPPASARFSP
ncbi:MAG: tetratricopeptide repeat protein [Verrucomicrobia bacterium]|nr:tetratricopeptide repeat protein [Verrucomicrobiota bacterium]MBU4366749.1 tetratricopeptide repeat protein [Verrucomicrobiota bacterium]